MGGDDTYTFGAVVACAIPLVLMCTSDEAPGTFVAPLSSSFYVPQADADKDGSLNFTEMYDFVTDFQQQHVSSGNSVFSIVDKDGSGEIDANEFNSLVVGPNADANDSSQQIFSLVDVNDDGKLTANEYALVTKPTEQGLFAAVQGPESNFIYFVLLNWPLAALFLVGGQLGGFTLVYLATTHEQDQKGNGPKLMGQLAILYFLGLFSAMAGPLHALRLLVPYAPIRMLLVLGGGFAAVYLSTLTGKNSSSDEEKLELMRGWVGDECVSLLVRWANWLWWGAHRGGGGKATEEKVLKPFCISVTDTLSLSGMA
jgi:hypothetical protein